MPLLGQAYPGSHSSHITASTREYSPGGHISGGWSILGHWYPPGQTLQEVALPKEYRPREQFTGVLEGVGHAIPRGEIGVQLRSVNYYTDNSCLNTIVAILCMTL